MHRITLFLTLYLPRSFHVKKKRHVVVSHPVFPVPNVKNYQTHFSSTLKLNKKIN